MESEFNVAAGTALLATRDARAAFLEALPAAVGAAEDETTLIGAAAEAEEAGGCDAVAPEVAAL